MLENQGGLFCKAIVKILAVSIVTLAAAAKVTAAAKPLTAMYSKNGIEIGLVDREDLWQIATKV